MRTMLMGAVIILTAYVGRGDPASTIFVYLVFIAGVLIGLRSDGDD